MLYVYFRLCRPPALHLELERCNKALRPLISTPTIAGDLAAELDPIRAAVAKVQSSFSSSRPHVGSDTPSSVAFPVEKKKKIEKINHACISLLPGWI